MFTLPYIPIKDILFKITSYKTCQFKFTIEPQAFLERFLICFFRVGMTALHISPLRAMVLLFFPSVVVVMLLVSGLFGSDDEFLALLVLPIRIKIQLK